MKNIKLDQYLNQVISLNENNLTSSDNLPHNLMITKKGAFETYYSPFEFINKKAKIVIVGITPGLQQARNALVIAQQIISQGGTIEEAQKASKVFASFSGSMRSNLIAMMDHIGLNNYLEIASTKSLFDDDQDLVHFTSTLRYPVFKDGKNFNEDPLQLKEQVMAWFAEECKLLNNAIYIPLGPKVSNVLNLMVELNILSSDQVLTGLQHPSGANAERVAYFLEKKERSLLSSRTNPITIDAAKESIMKKVSGLQNRKMSLVGIGA